MLCKKKKKLLKYNFITQIISTHPSVFKNKGCEDSVNLVSSACKDIRMCCTVTIHKAFLKEPNSSLFLDSRYFIHIKK